MASDLPNEHSRPAERRSRLEDEQRREDQVSPPDPSRGFFVRLVEATILGVSGALLLGAGLVLLVILLAVLLR